MPEQASGLSAGFAEAGFLRTLPVPAKGARAPAWWMLGKAEKRLGIIAPP
jgi:hypothetical protein